jgi:hypothetical protein
MLSPRFLRMYGEKCQRLAQAMDDPQSVAEFEAMARDLEVWANDPAGRATRAVRFNRTPRHRQTRVPNVRFDPLRTKRAASLPPSR